MKHVLIVGAGLAGAVYARELAEAGYDVRVIDKRNHIAGNCYDEVVSSGIRVHRYGPHLFHTNNREIVKWVERFASWIKYEHKVKVRLANGALVPFPINIATLNSVLGCNIENEVQAKFKLAEIKLPIENVENAEDQLYKSIGPLLTNIFYRPYTLKMWGMDLKEIDAAVVKRIEIRTDNCDLYFPNDSFQILPERGYTDFFYNILNHQRINVCLQTPFKHEMLDQCGHCFNSMPIDEFFDFTLGELPYRSIRFHTKEISMDNVISAVTINYSDSGPYTRETWWHNLPGHLIRDTGNAIQTIEEPCDYRDNNYERYYPVKTSDRRFDQIYRQYHAMAKSLGHVDFIGRCGTYQYLDMHQVINQSLQGAARWLCRL